MVIQGAKPKVKRAQPTEKKTRKAKETKVCLQLMVM